jgi:hypothetical protein
MRICLPCGDAVWKNSIRNPLKSSLNARVKNGESLLNKCRRKKRCNYRNISLNCTSLRKSQIRRCTKVSFLRILKRLSFSNEGPGNPWMSSWSQIFQLLIKIPYKAPQEKNDNQAVTTSSPLRKRSPYN